MMRDDVCIVKCSCCFPDSREFLLERVELYCDADRRSRIDPELLEKNSPTLEEVYLIGG